MAGIAHLAGEAVEHVDAVCGAGAVLGEVVGGARGDRGSVELVAGGREVVGAGCEVGEGDGCVGCGGEEEGEEGEGVGG